MKRFIEGESRNRTRNFTPYKLAQRMKPIDARIKRYLQELDTSDRTQSPDAGRRGQHIQEKLGKLCQQMGFLRQIDEQPKLRPDEQLSLTDPDARSMATSGRGTGMVGNNVHPRSGCPIFTQRLKSLVRSMPCRVSPVPTHRLIPRFRG